MGAQNQETATEDRGPVEVACFGMITPCIVLVVDRLPEHNTGELIREWGEFVYDDAAIVATLMRSWDVSTGLIGTTLGDDRRGREVVRRLQELGVRGEIRLSPEFATPLEVDVSDPGGARTYFWRREPEVLASLDSADLSLIEGASVLYVDWYDGDHILRAMQEAARLGIPVFLNLEHGHQEAQIMSRYVPGAVICQAVTDAAQRGGDPVRVARELLEAGVETVLVTLGAEGSVGAARDEYIRVRAPEVQVLDGAAAGATFSAGYLYGFLRGWELERALRFATAAASLKCTVVGPKAFPVQEIESLANGMRVERHPSALEAS